MSESGNKASPSSKTRWHLLLGAVLDPLLKPVGIEVFAELPVMKTPPKVGSLVFPRR